MAQFITEDLQLIIPILLFAGIAFFLALGYLERWISISEAQWNDNMERHRKYSEGLERAMKPQPPAETQLVLNEHEKLVRDALKKAYHLGKENELQGRRNSSAGSYSASLAFGQYRELVEATVRKSNQIFEKKENAAGALKGGA
jgi:hypothetical protein